MFRKPRQQGFTIVELLIVIIIVGILAAIAVPLYLGQRDKAKEGALRLNARNVHIAAGGYVADGLSTSWQKTHALTNGTLSTYATTHASCALEEGIKKGGASGTNAEGYRNPYSSKTLVINATGIPSGANVRPAIWITQQTSTYRYGSFPTNAATKANLAGSVVACWNTTTSNIEVFFVNKNGAKSPTCTYLKM